jgi:hypothetical protein
MAEHQDQFSFDGTLGSAPVVPADLRDEIAQVWGLPLGQRVEVSLQNRDTIAGALELISTPSYPWDPHQPLRLRIKGFAFTTKEIEHWVLL